MEIGTRTLELSCLRHEFCTSFMNERAWEGRVKERWEGWWWEGRMGGGIEHGRVEWKVNERSNLAEEIQILEFC